MERSLLIEHRMKVVQATGADGSTEAEVATDVRYADNAGKAVCDVTPDVDFFGGDIRGCGPLPRVLAEQLCVALSMFNLLCVRVVMILIRLLGRSPHRCVSAAVMPARKHGDSRSLPPPGSMRPPRPSAARCARRSTAALAGPSRLWCAHSPHTRCCPSACDAPLLSPPPPRPPPLQTTNVLWMTTCVCPLRPTRILLGGCRRSARR